MAALELLLSKLSINTATATILRNFARQKPRPEPPRHLLCGVLILLYVDDNAKLSVLLNTRSLNLRTHPGDVCFPGGRIEPEDENIQVTALREAKEENGIDPIQLEMIFLCTLPTFVSATGLFVVPSIYFTPRSSEFLQTLVPNRDEVEEIFGVEMDHFFGKESAIGEEKVVHKHVDMIWLAGTNYRLHEFHHSSFPRKVSGLTADILLTTVLIGAGLTDEEEELEVGTMKDKVGRLGFQRRAKDQMTWRETFQVAQKSKKEDYFARK